MTPSEEGFLTDPERPRLLEEAAERFATTIDRRPTRAERADLKAWLEADPRHAQAYESVARLWEGSGELPELKSRQGEKPTISRRDLGKAAIVLAVGGTAAWYLTDHPFADYRTGPGERHAFATPDGSQIELAPQTRLSVSFTDRMRSIELHDGEAFFRVASDARPFEVAAGDARVTALGTMFGVEYRDNAGRVIVTEHATRVTLGDEITNVNAGSRLRYDKRHIGEPEIFDPDIELSWREGRLVFSHEPLGDVVAALNRWQRGRIVVMDRALAARPVTLVVNVDRSATIVDHLERALPVRVVRMTGLLTLLLPEK